MALDREIKLHQLSPMITGPQAGIAANAEKIWESAMVRTTAGGYLVKVGDGTVAATGPVVGIARFTASGGTTNGEYSLDTYHGVFGLPNSSTTPVTQASYGKAVYAEDDEKVCADPSFPVAGTMWGFTEDGLVIVAVDPGNSLRTAASVGELAICPTSWYLNDGNPLAAFAAGASPTPGLSFNGSKAAAIRWNNDATPGQIVSSFPVPKDLDTAKPVYILLTAAKVGATPADVPTFAVELFEHLVGSTYDAGSDLGGTTNAMTDEPTKEVQALALVVAGGSLSDPSAGTNTITITMQPEAGKLTSDDLLLLSTRILYTPTI